MKKLLIAFISFVLFSVTACENDLEKVKQVSLERLKPVKTSYDVEVIYSDSAKVKVKMDAPVVLQFETNDPYYEMPKGVKAVFFDENLKQTSTVTSEYAIRRENQKIVELRKNVVATNAKGETFKSEELIWDENQKRFYSNKIVNITTVGRTIMGTKFWSNEDFSYYEIAQGTGVFDVKDDLTQ